MRKYLKACYNFNIKTCPNPKLIAFAQQKRFGSNVSHPETKTKPKTLIIIYYRVEWPRLETYR